MTVNVNTEGEVSTKFDYLSNKELGSYIRAEIKKLGYTNRQVSVSVKDCGYSTSIDCYVKDLSIDLKPIEEIVQKVEYLRYDPYCQEILSGCNRFTTVKYAWEVLRDARNAEMENAKKFLEPFKEKTSTIKVENNDKYVLYAIPNSDKEGHKWNTWSYCVFKNGSQFGDRIADFYNWESVVNYFAEQMAFEKARKNK